MRYWSKYDQKWYDCDVIYDIEIGITIKDRHSDIFIYCHEALMDDPEYIRMYHFVVSKIEIAGILTSDVIDREISKVYGFCNGGVSEESCPFNEGG